MTRKSVAASGEFDLYQVPPNDLAATDTEGGNYRGNTGFGPQHAPDQSKGLIYANYV